MIKRDSSYITESLSSSTIASWMSCAYEKSVIKSSKITHNRVSGCKGAEENGVQEAQVIILLILFSLFIT